MKLFKRRFVILLVTLNVFVYVTSLIIWQSVSDHPLPVPTLAVIPGTVLATPVPEVASNEAVRPVENSSRPVPVSSGTLSNEPSAVYSTPDRLVQVNRAPIPNQLVLTFASGTSPAAQLEYLDSIHATLVQRIDNLNTVIVHVEVPVPSEQLASPLLIATEPDYYAAAQLTDAPDDPLFADQWALPAVGVPTGWSQLPENTPDILVAVIDSGVCASHPDLVGHVQTGVSFVPNDAGIEDTFGHGCAITGVIAASMNNTQAIAGIAPNARIMPLRVLDGHGIGSYSSVASAIVYATDQGAQIINLSLGGGSPSNLLENAVNYATGHGVTLIAAAGNQGSASILYPAAYPNVIAVGALERDLSVSSFSNYGSGVDVYAPGRDIVTLSLNNTTTTATGTSIATAITTGVVTLEKAFGRSLAPGNVLAFNPTSMVDVVEPDGNLLARIAPEVEQAITTNGTARVMIALNLPVNAQDDTARAQTIAIAQGDVLAQLSAEDFSLAHQFANMPALAGTLTGDGLATLRASSAISQIYLDEPTEAASMLSAIAINADDVQTGAVNGLTLTGEGVNVAVLDSGIDMSNPAVADDVVAQQCFSGTNGCPGGTDRASIAPDMLHHGTNVSAIITAPEGVAPDAGIVALRVLDDFGRGYSSDWVAALDWIYAEVNANRLSVDVINMSLGSLKLYKSNAAGTGTSCDMFYPTEAQAVQRMIDLNIIIVSATGNQGSKDSINAPACLSNVIAVGAIYDREMGAEPDTGTYNSQLRGNWPNCADTVTAANQITCFTNSSGWMDLVAPGAQIIVGNTGGSGTSQAAPHVAAVAALMVQAGREGETPFAVTPARVTGILRSSGSTVTDPRNGIIFRSLDAFAAVNLLVNPVAFTSCAEVIGMTEAECNALVALYDATRGENWTVNTGWKQVNTPCTWAGISCNGSGHVEEIGLSDNLLTGSLPDAFFQLPYLKSLVLTTNNLSGSLPPGISNLTALETLNLSTNQLTDQIPASTGTMSSLRSLDLSFNRLSGAFDDVGLLSDLESLKLNGNTFGTAIPASFGNLVNLVTLEMQQSELNGTLPAEMVNMTALESLNLSINYLNGNLPSWVVNHPTLKVAVLGGNRFTGVIPASASATPLQTLNLDNNRFSGGIPPQIGALTNLIDLDLTGNPLGGTIPPALGNLVNLQRLALGNNNLSGTLPPELGNLSQLRQMFIFGSNLSGSIPATFGQLDNLAYLSLTDNKLSGELPVELSDMSSLEQLDLGANNLTGDIDLAPLTTLSNVYLFRNHFTYLISLPPNFVNADLSYNDISSVDVFASYLLPSIINVSYNAIPVTGNPPELQATLDGWDADWAETQRSVALTAIGVDERDTPSKNVYITVDAPNNQPLKAYTHVEVLANEVGFADTNTIAIYPLDFFWEASLNAYRPIPITTLDAREGFYFWVRGSYRFEEQGVTVWENNDSGNSPYSIGNLITGGPVGGGVAGCAASLYNVECPALADLYDMTDGANWTNNTGWTTDENACNWLCWSKNPSEHGSRPVTQLYDKYGVNLPKPGYKQSLEQSEFHREAVEVEAVWFAECLDGDAGD